jgi:hypothetical protein
MILGKRGRTKAKAQKNRLRFKNTSGGKFGTAQYVNMKLGNRWLKILEPEPEPEPEPQKLTNTINSSNRVYDDVPCPCPYLYLSLVPRWPVAPHHRS